MKTRFSSIQVWPVTACAIGILILAGVESIALGQSRKPLTASARLNASQQIQALLADTAQWGKAQQKLDSQLTNHHSKTG